MTFGDKLLRLRETRGLSQEDLGKAIMATQRKISYLETGKTEPSLEDIRRLCVYFHVTADYLLGIPYGLDKPD